MDISSVTRQKNYNMQESMRSDANLAHLNIRVDESLTYLFYHFLRGDTNQLPNYKYLKKVLFDDNRRTSVVSSGCGMTLNDELLIKYVNPLSNNSIRVYSISPEEYSVIDCTYKKDGSFDTKDALSDSEFNLKRIDHLRKYLSGFVNKYLESNSKTRY